MAAESNTSHLVDPFLLPFRKPSFDPVEYLDNNLPSLCSTKAAQTVEGAIPLSELCPLAQTLVSQLSANAAKLTTILTQLTDEVIRSGSRLAYEVEILRGNTLNLSEALTDALQDDLAKFVLSSPVDKLTKNKSDDIKSPKSQSSLERDPSFIRDLRTLCLVRSRLEAVIKTFGDAMAWNFPPSELSTASSFLSISGPDTGSGENECSVEEKGQQVLKKMNKEITDLLMSDDPIYGVEEATKRVQELQNLATVWKGTSEERARTNFVQNLAKMVEDRHRTIIRDKDQDSCLHRGSQKMPEAEKEIEESKPRAGYGFISQLQKLRGQ